VPFVHEGVRVREETIERMSGRARSDLKALPPWLRDLDGEGESYPV